MKKRTLATVLWALTGWYIGAVVGWILGIPAVLPVVFAVGAGALIWVDPRHVFWVDPGRTP